VPRHADDVKGQVASGSNREGESTEAMRKLLQKHGFAPKLAVTDKLRSRAAAFSVLRLTCRHGRGLRPNNRAENSHQAVGQCPAATPNAAGLVRRWLCAGGSRIRTRGPTTKRKAMGNHSRQASPPRTWTCKWLRLSCRRLQLATPRRTFRRSGTEGSNPVPSTKSYDMRPTVRGRSPGRAKQLATAITNTSLRFFR